MLRWLRYRQVSLAIAPLITRNSLGRLDKTLEQALAKSQVPVVPGEERPVFNQSVIDRANEILAAENGRRIHEWTEGIIAAEKPNGVENMLYLLCGILTGAILVIIMVLIIWHVH